MAHTFSARKKYQIDRLAFLHPSCSGLLGFMFSTEANRTRTCPSDEELALQLQADDMKAIIQLVLNARFAWSLDCALNSDGWYLDSPRIMEQGAEDDHRAALALQNGGAHPAQSDVWKPVLIFPQ